jgi:hypothetical protein
MDSNEKKAGAGDVEITDEERALIDSAFSDGDSKSENELKRSQLDNTDEDGIPLNEQSSAGDGSGNDLDIPGAEDDDNMEDIGEEDEENNSYSEADTE